MWTLKYQPDTSSSDYLTILFQLCFSAPKFYPDPSTPGADRVAYLVSQMEKIAVESISYGSICFRQHTHECQAPGGFDVKYAKRKQNKNGKHCWLHHLACLVTYRIYKLYIRHYVMRQTNYKPFTIHHCKGQLMLSHSQRGTFLAFIRYTLSKKVPGHF